MEKNIHRIGQAIQEHIDENWENVFRDCEGKMLELYPKIGDSVYAIYGKHLFEPVHQQFKAMGLQASPKLPGSLMNSREWGESESERQRWMWSKISDENQALGTIVIVVFHDHLQVRVPQAFRVIALEVTGQAAVINALLQQSPEFRDALDMREEIAQYLAANPEHQA